MTPCRQCGLTSGRFAWVAEDGSSFCCTGCRLLFEIQAGSGTPGHGARARLMLGTFFAVNASIFTLVLGGVDAVYPSASASASGRLLADLFRHLALFLSIPAILLLGWPLLGTVIRGRGAGRVTDALLLLGTLAAFALSCVSVLRGDGPVYFEVATVTLAFLSLGRYLDAKARTESADSVKSLIALAPDTALRIRRSSEDEDRPDEELPRKELRVGDWIRVRPGSRVPIDGHVVRGRADVDESFLTGEARPRSLSPGEKIHAGAYVLDGALDVEVEIVENERRLDRMARAVEEARGKRAPIVVKADRVALVFLLASSAIAALSCWYWTVTKGLGSGISAGLAVLLAACPCALGLATPLAFSQAIGRAARGGVLFTSGEAVERLASLKVLFFDKTGTLTDRAPAIAAMRPANGTPVSTLVNVASWAETPSEHPIGRAIAKEAAATPPPAEFHVIAGRGVQALSPEREVVVGDARLLEERGLAIPDELSTKVQEDLEKGRTVVYVAERQAGRAVFGLLGAIALTESVRPEAHRAIRELFELGLRLAILTGDGPGAAENVGLDLGLPAKSRMSPEAKAELLIGAGVPAGLVGDGWNDAPALAAAGVGIAMGGGVELSQRNAAVVLPGDDLTRIPWAIRVAQSTMRAVTGTLVFAFGYNAVLIAFAAAGRINPVLAAVAMTASSLSVAALARKAGRVKDAAAREDRDVAEASPHAPLRPRGNALGAF